MAVDGEYEGRGHGLVQVVTSYEKNNIKKNKKQKNTVCKTYSQNSPNPEEHVQRVQTHGVGLDALRSAMFP